MVVVAGEKPVGFAAFEIVGENTPWPAGAKRRMAGVSSFGVGGTNAHVIIEEAPRAAAERLAPSPQLLLVSARSQAALDESCARLATYLEEHPQASLNDVAFTLHAGRREHALRRAVVASQPLEALTTRLGWQVLRLPEFNKYTNAFQRSRAALVDAARARDGEAALPPYNGLVSSCVECHRYVARSRIARNAPAR